MADTLGLVSSGTFASCVLAAALAAFIFWRFRPPAARALADLGDAANASARAEALAAARARQQAVLSAASEDSMRAAEAKAKQKHAQKLQEALTVTSRVQITGSAIGSSGGSAPYRPSARGKG